MNAHPHHARASQWWAVCFGFCVGVGIVGLAELVVRLRYPYRFSPEVADPVLNHRWRPASSWEHREWMSVGIPPYVHDYNAQGWITREEVQPRKPAGRFRVFYVGDSFTEGTCPMERSVPSLVHAALADRFQQAGLQVEVINTGTSSYSPILYYLLIRHRLLDYDPDLIVVNIDMTDVFDDFVYRETVLYDSEGNPVACPPRHRLKGKYLRTADGLVKKSLRGEVMDALREHLLIVDVAARALLSTPFWRVQEAPEQVATKRAEHSPGTFDWCKPQWSMETEQDVAFSMGILRKLTQLTKAHRVKLVITGVPHLQHFQTGEDGWQYSRRPFEAIRRVCEEEGVAYLDSYGGFVKRMDGTPPAAYYIPRNLHFNERGYQLWAAIHTEFLLDPDNALLPTDVLLAHERGPQS